MRHLAHQLRPVLRVLHLADFAQDLLVRLADLGDFEAERDRVDQVVHEEALVRRADGFARSVRVVVLDVVIQTGDRDQAHHAVDVSAVDDHHQVLHEAVLVAHLRKRVFELPSFAVRRDAEAAQDCQQLRSVLIQCHGHQAKNLNLTKNRLSI